MKYMVIVGLCLIFSGCMTLTKNASLLVPPSEKPTLVESNAVAHCQDMLIVEQCTLQLEMSKKQ